MIKIQKFKFKNCIETIETKDITVVSKVLKDYIFCSNNFDISTKFVGEYAICEVIK